MNEALSFGTVFVAGLLSFFSPCILPVLPVYIGVLSDEESKGKTIKLGRLNIQVSKLIKTLLFVLGISVIFLVLGFGAGALSPLMQSRYFLPVAGGIVILLGLHQTGILQIKFLQKEKKIQMRNNIGNEYLSSFLLGLLFSFGWSPCLGPIMFSVFTLSSAGGQQAYAVVLMMIYASGLMIPFFLISVFSDVLLGKVAALRKRMPVFKVFGGILIIFMGILLMTNGINRVTNILLQWFS